ncbi:DUF2075 domain-containing protein [Marinilactibacillus piezotolerans]|uniref:DUF2075 domain-containing protein n=1 Tax=Marinilactibacillus piezotolerans TaxID=258723 RepID=UPI0009B007C4|nr:DUF2075 domain-containing protein [Marinilactibacillus piezotolerans]
MSRISTPKIYSVPFGEESLNNLQEELSNKSKDTEKLIFDFPTVYIVNHQDRDGVSVYIGETSDIIRRTSQHLRNDPLERKDWETIKNASNSNMFIIGHDYFNKSLTMDIENKLMLYMSSLDGVKEIYNRRSNDQKEYYTSDKLNDIFSKVWQELRRKNKNLFPLESVIKDSALFKASPFHKLTKEQSKAKNEIMLKILSAMTVEKESQLIFVHGEAGTGKTVLLSSLFYDLFQETDEGNPVYKDTNNYLLVNHDEQLTVYQQIMEKLGVLKSGNEFVGKPTRFINQISPEEKVDVVLIDEGHLLLTQGKQSYRGNNHLKDILERAKVVVLIFDENQILTTEQYWENHKLIEFKEKALDQNNYIKLEKQIRIKANIDTVNWIRDIIDKGEVQSIPNDKEYDLRIFNSPEELDKEIKKKANNQDFGLSRLLATYDWPYHNKNLTENGEYWKVKIDQWSKPWNLLSHEPKEIRSKVKDLAWAEQPQTIDQVGSTFTIQGFDLNYAGVIIGPSVIYRDGKIQFDPDASANKKATRNRTLENGEKESFADTFLRNELNVLLTRGVNGLYIYAVDKELREALLAAQK